MARTALPQEHPLYDEILDVFLSYGPAVESRGTAPVGPDRRYGERDHR